MNLTEANYQHDIEGLIHELRRQFRKCDKRILKNNNDERKKLPTPKGIASIETNDL